MLNKYIRIIFFSSLIITITIFLYQGELTNERINSLFIDNQYYGIIEEIEYQENRRGLPSIRLRRDWLHLGLSEQKIMNYINIQDSIAKDSGSAEIRVYKKTENGNWNERVFK